MSDLYEDLGVPRDADADAIKAAHRAGAKRTHPDKPDGDRDEFDKVQHAYMVLSDPDLRARYDRGDDINQKRPSVESQAVSILCDAFNVAMQAVDIVHDDIMAHTREEISARAKQVRAQRDHLLTVVDKLETIIDRVKAKGDRDFIGFALRDQLNDARRGLENLEEQIKAHVAAGELTKEFEYRVDERAPPAPDPWTDNIRPAGLLSMEDLMRAARDSQRHSRGGPFFKIDPGA